MGFIVSLLALPYDWGMTYDDEDYAPVLGSLTLSVQKDTLNAQLYQVLLHEVFRELSQQIALIVALQASFVHKPVSTAFTDLPLAEGLEKILIGTDYALTHTNKLFSPSSDEIRQFWDITVMSRVKKSNKSLTPQQDTVQQQWVRLASKGHQSNAQQLSLVSEARNSAALESQTYATVLGNEQIHEQRAVQHLESSIPQDQLVNMALKNSNPTLQIQALELLTEYWAETAEDTLQQALEDPNQDVRELAQELLEDLDIFETEMDQNL